jgi:phosphopantothenoylcysteine decarboxylase / phosphopantothenate---cysteine ligase
LDTSKVQNSKLGSKSLKGKKVLITAGPTWVAIDSVRVISNVATGETGKLLAEKLNDSGANVTLLINSEDSCYLNKRILIKPFRFFDTLEKNILRELTSSKFDIFIHTAAVSDYRPARSFRGKIKSGKNKLRLDLIPTSKIINRIKEIDDTILLVGFKYEPVAGKEQLIRETKKLINNSNADIVIANTSDKNSYRAYILGRDKVFCGPVTNKPEMVKKLIEAICGLLV